MGAMARGCLTTRIREENVEVVPRERDDLRVLLPPWICYVVWKAQLPSLNLSFPLCKRQKGLSAVRGQNDSSKQTKVPAFKESTAQSANPSWAVGFQSLCLSHHTLSASATEQPGVQ